MREIKKKEQSEGISVAVFFITDFTFLTYKIHMVMKIVINATLGIIIEIFLYLVNSILQSFTRP